MDGYDLLVAMDRAFHHASSQEDRRAIEGGMKEIQKLRAAQFRWVPVSERRPTKEDANADGLVLGFLRGRDHASVLWNHLGGEGILSHWAAIPPVPERSQAEKDEAAWVEYWCASLAPEGTLGEKAKAAFLAGLKLGREGKA